MLSSSALQGRELQTHSRILRRGSISPPPPLWTERLDLSFIGGGPRPPIIARRIFQDTDFLNCHQSALADHLVQDGEQPIDVSLIIDDFVKHRQNTR